jgi:tetratricopeptide (TPR) repeat protein
LAAAPAVAGLPVQPDPAVEARLDSLVRAAVNHAYDGRLDLAMETVDLAEELAPRDPRVGLTRFRLLRENYPIGVFDKERARRQEAALLHELDHTIAMCDSMLELDENDAAAYLYRGWAYINKAQTLLIARHMRAAAGSSRHGKSDFDKFYELHPEGDPDAATVLGSFLYFADTLPGFFKFIRWLVRLPGGDRERGLELMEEGAAGRGYTYPDAVLMLAVTYYLFDGNLEDSARMLDQAVRDYPHHPWVVEYSCSMSFLFPELTGRAAAVETALLDGWNDTTRGWDEAVRYRILWSLGRQFTQLGDYEEALSSMTAIAADAPAEPFWIAPTSHLSAISLAARLGRSLDAAWLCERIPDEERYKELSDGYKSACGWVADDREAVAFNAIGAVRNALYEGSVDEAARLLDQVVASGASGLDTRYMQAEVDRVSGLEDEAEEIYAAVALEAESAGRRTMQIQSLVRLGEIHIGRGEFDAAREAYEKAADAESETTMVANFLRGRLRYIERQKD